MRCADGHQEGTVHGDLRAEKLLVDANLNIKIANSVFSDKFTFYNKAGTFWGSMPHAAPQLFQGRTPGSPADYTGQWILAF